MTLWCQRLTSPQCKNCRRRKQRCDGIHPHCGACTQRWEAQCSVPPPVGFASVLLPLTPCGWPDGLSTLSHPAHPMCQYDFSVDDPDDHVATLEKEICTPSCSVPAVGPLPDTECFLAALQIKLRAAKLEHSHTGLAPQQTHSNGIVHRPKMVR